MKKIIIVTKKMVIGGIEKALIKMLENMDNEGYDITVLIIEKGGELEKLIPKYVKVKYLMDENFSIKNNIKSDIKKFKILKATKGLIYSVLANKSKNIYDSYTYLTKVLSNQYEEYDLAIAYHTPISLPLVYVINNIKSKNKIAWIHSDIDRYSEHISEYEKYYLKYNHIFSVSEEGKDKFIKKFPKCKNKISVFYNSIYDKEIQAISNENIGFKDNYNGLRIVTVGRLSEEKGYEYIVNVVKRLKIDGYKFKWYAIGDGPQKNKLQSEIKYNEIEDKFILLGSKLNPYSYMKQCDIYVQPSKTEGYCTTITEAKCLNKTIIATDVNGIREQIKNNITGIVVPTTENGIYDGLRKILDDNTLRYNLEKNLSLERIDTRYEFKKLDRFL